MEIKDVKTGVDMEWIADSRLALKEVIRRLPSAIEESDPASHAATAAAYADAMREERNKRGGARKSDDPREIMSLIQEHLPLVFQFFEKLDEIGSKRRKREHGHDGD